jgi:hypothetical protein
VLEISEDVYLVARPEVARQGAHPHVAFALDREVDELSARGRPAYRLSSIYRDDVRGKWVFRCRVVALEGASDSVDPAGHTSGPPRTASVNMIG